MKINCDVCESQPAAVFCSADEAALCNLCDRRVHHANKLAGKHLRFSLLGPSPADSPLCDICQERRAFVFCREDRAIFCRECNIQIHSSSEFTQLHNRFLLTGVKVSSTASVYPNSSDGCGHSTSPPSYLNGDSVPNGPVGVSSNNRALGHSKSASVTTSYNTPCCYNNPYQTGSSECEQENSISTSDYNVAEYYTTSSDLFTVGDDLFYTSPSPHFFPSKNTDYTMATGNQQADSSYGYQYY